jgi:hypothetical protein
LKTIKGNIDSSYSFEFTALEGNGQDYFLSQIQSVDEAEYFNCALFKNGVLKLDIQLAVYPDGSAISLPKAPFGGFWVYSNVNSLVFVNFLEELKEFLKSIGVNEFKLIQAPGVYMAYADWVIYFLAKQGFNLEKVLSHQIFEGKKKMKSELKSLQAKFAKKIKEHNIKISIGNIQSFNFLNEIKAWNQSKGYDLTFDENQLIAQVSSFPDRYFVISVSQEGQFIGHALAVKLTSNSVYYFLSAINPKSKVKLTGELIMVNLLRLAVEQKANFLDLGSSEIGGLPNHSLIFFKSRFSNCTQNKYSWRIKL